ncbi:MAG TPA: sensor histidine kinase [Deltaproteobacteria bacterium]|nr:sensor histidine kinase [Deltaproteobacteria bacterium]
MNRRTRELEAKNKVITSIFRISSLLTQNISIDEILYAILLSAKKDLGFSAACLFLINNETALLECRMITGFGEKGEYWAYNKPFHMEKHDCMETRVVKSGQVMYFEDTLHDPRLTTIDQTITTRLNRGRVVYSPLTVKGKIIGCMGVNRPLEEQPISTEEIEAFTIFANQASIIVENSQSLKQLMSERNLNENILDSSPNGILTIDSTGKIISINRTAEAILSFHQKDILNRNIRDMTLHQSLLSLLREILSSPSRQSRKEYDFRRPDGSRCYLEITSSPLQDMDGNETGTLFLLQDLTERKIISDQVQRMEKLASIGQLAAGIAHEIRNPLMGIGATLELTMQNLSADDPRRSMLVRAMEEIEGIDDIISDLLDFAKPKEMNFQTCDINDIVNDAAQFLSGLCYKDNIELIVHCGGTPPPVQVDRDRIKQVIINIALNAIQSMGNNGVLTIETSMIHHTYYGLSNGGISIIIEDNGRGISPELKERVFDPFFTTRAKGTGLGLYNCHRIIEAHSGNIVIEDAPGEGTKVIVMIPEHGRDKAHHEQTAHC